MSTFSTGSLRIRLALGLGLLAVLLTGALTLVIGELATTLARKEIGRYLTRLSIEMRDKLDTGMSERVSEIRMLANLDGAIDGRRNPELRRAMLEELKRATADYSWLGYVDAGGKVLVSLAGMLHGEDVSARPWFKRALGGTYVGDVHDARMLAALLPKNGNELPRFVDVAFPLRNAGGIYGVVGAHVSWEWAARLRDSIESYARPEVPYELLVVASDGLVLLGPKGMAGAKLPREELSPSQLRVYEARLERWTDGVTYLTGTSATRGFGEYRGLGWVVIARQRADHAFAPVRLLQLRIAIAGGLIAVLAILLGWWIATRVSRPLSGISVAADAISHGSRRVQIPSGGGYAEVERLAVSLRTMLSSLTRHEEDLRQAQSQLEARVRERTAELAKARAEMELEAAELTVARDEAAAAKDQLALAMEASRLVLWDYDVASERVFLSETWSTLLGLPSAPTTTTIRKLIGLVPDEDRPKVTAAITSAIKGPNPSYRIEHRVETEVGDVVWIVSEGKVVSRDPQGRALRMLGTNRDISERVRHEQALRESEARFKAALENSAIGIALVGLDGRWLKVNRALAQIVGYSEAELLALTFQDITDPEDLDADLQYVGEMLAGSRSTYEMKKRYIHRDGHPVWIQLNVALVSDPAGKPLYFISQIQDISARHNAEAALRESEEQFRGAMEHSATGMAIVGLDGRWRKVNPALCAITGYTADELLARTFTDITHPEDRPLSPAQLQELLAGRRDTYQIEKRYVHKRGHVVWVHASVSLVRDTAGQPLHLISQIIDVSERHRLQAEVEHLALHDQLTGLPNSRLLLDRLAQALATARRTGRPIGVMYMDLDGFKPVNDTYGHAAGDLVLKEFSARVTRVLRETDTIARVGGDEFVAVLGEVEGEAEAQMAAERVLAAIARPFDLGGAQAALSTSIGIALFPAHGEDPQSLLQRADTAMYQAKRAGKNSFRFFAGGQT